MVFSDNFYILYGGFGWGGMGSGDVERVEEKRWVNKPHPRLADPDDRRGAQLRRGQVRLFMYVLNICSICSEADT